MEYSYLKTIVGAGDNPPWSNDRVRFPVRVQGLQRKTMKEIIKTIKENEFIWTESQKLNYLKTKNLTIKDIHQLYCYWYDCNKSNLQGNKNQLLYGLARTMDSGRAWWIISK